MDMGTHLVSLTLLRLEDTPLLLYLLSNLLFVAGK